MAQQPGAESVVNPFATSRVRPGALEFLYPPGVDTAQLVEQLAQYGWRAAIVGPHGSGKSTLLAALLEQLKREGRGLVHITLHDGQRRLPAEAAHVADGVLTVIDGFEQLGWWWRWRLLHGPRWRRRALLVTTHEPCALPTLFRTAPTPEVTTGLVARLLPEGDVTVTAADAVAEHHRHGGNVREALFGLYDLYELRRRTPRRQPPS